MSDNKVNPSLANVVLPALENNSVSRQNIVLIGFMGTGKSSVARYLHDMCHMKLAEMDDILADREQMSIPEIFAAKGEEYFRTQETKLLRELQEKKNLIISCGGGAALREENVSIMKQNSYVILLTAQPDTIYKRVGSDENRPVLDGRRSPQGWTCSFCCRER